MKITSLTINDFRCFKDAKFNIGKNITIFSGTNAVGKSTILGLLGNSCELKSNKGRPILQSAFRCEWSDLFKMSPTFDTSKSNIASISYDSEPDLKYRITWQENNTRGRLIPSTKTADGKLSNAKLSHPSLYLGLSRLFPLGEALISSDKNPIAIDNISDSFLTNYQKILSINENIQSVNRVYLDGNNKSPIGINTDKYDYLTNSAGQDNLAQILLAVESFRKLQIDFPDDYNGGLLLIDELDAALHPSAQNKLFDYLYKSSKELDLQIIFTTHSISLLDYARLIAEPQQHSHDDIKPIEIYFLSRANNESTPTIISSPGPLLYKNLLQETSTRMNQKIKIITEDAEARWVLNHLLPESILHKVNLLDTNVGCNEVLSLSKCDPCYFGTRIIILDGDIKTKRGNMNDIAAQNASGNHIYILPSTKSIEESLYDFLTSNSDNSNEYLTQQMCLENGLTYNYFKNTDLSIFKRRGKKREKLKEWFKYHQAQFDDTNLFRYWIKDYEQEGNDLIESIKNAVSIISKKLYIPE